MNNKKKITSIAIPFWKRRKLINYIKSKDPYYEFTNLTFYTNAEILNLAEKVKKEKIVNREQRNKILCMEIRHQPGRKKPGQRCALNHSTVKGRKIINYQ